MAFYPTEDYKILTGTTKEEVETKTQQAIADGYELIADNVIYDNDYKDSNFPYTQAVVKKTNTDDAYIAKLVAAFQPLINSINTKLDQISAQLGSANTKLDQIESNTNKQ